MSGNAVVTAVPLAMGETGCRIAYFSHSARTAHGEPRRSAQIVQRAKVACMQGLAGSLGLTALMTRAQYKSNNHLTGGSARQYTAHCGEERQ